MAVRQLNLPGLKSRHPIGSVCVQEWYDYMVRNQIIRITATEAAREFSTLLDRVAAGTEAVVERHNEAVAVISPPVSVPRRISECLAADLPRVSVGPDPQFAADLEEIITEGSPSEPPQWD